MRFFVVYSILPFGCVRLPRIKRAMRDQNVSHLSYICCLFLLLSPRTEQSECLTDEPMVREVKMAHQKPGLIYDADEQCRQSYGEGSSICEGSSLTVGGVSRPVCN